MLASKKGKIIEGRNSHLEHERGKLSQRIVILQEELKRLELKILTRKDELRRRNDELLKNQLEVANALIRALQNKAAEAGHNVSELSTALEEEKRRNQSLQQRIIDSTKHFQDIIHLQDEKEVLRSKIISLDATVDAMEKDRQEARSARNSVLCSFKAAMKKAGEDRINLLNQLAYHASHEGVASPVTNE
jgi:chromosome segregation ATPase